MESGRDDRRWRTKEELTGVSRDPVRRGTEQVMKYNRKMPSHAELRGSVIRRGNPLSIRRRNIPRPIGP